MQSNRRAPQRRPLRGFRSFRVLQAVIDPLIESLEKRQLFASIDLGSIALVRVGSGSAALGSAAQQVFIDQYAIDAQGNIAATPTQSLPLPTAASGANHALTLSGVATSEGQLNRTSDGKYLLLAGYDAAPGTTGPSNGSIATSASTTVPRVVGRVDVTNGAFDTSTALNNAFSANNVRSVASTDGSSFWIAGTAAPTSNGGVFFSSLGAATGSQLLPGNIRNVNTANGQLYVSASSATSTFGIATLGSGLPTSGTQTVTTLPGFPTATGPSMYDFWFADANNLLVADDSASGAGVQHWRLSSGTWSKVATLTAPGGDNAFRSVTAAKSATDNSWLVFASSTAGIRSFRYDPVTSSTTVLGSLTAPTNTVFRGVEVFTDPAALALTLAPGNDTGASTTDRLTNINTPTFSVSITRAGTLGLDWTGDGIADLTQIITGTPTGPVQLTIPTALPDGTYNVKAIYTSADGANLTDQIAITIDTHGPVASNFLPPSISSGPNTFVLGALQFNEAIDVATVSLTDINAVVNGTTYAAIQVGPSSLQPNVYTISVPANTTYGTLVVGPDIRDLAGNLMNQDGDATNGEATQDQFNSLFAAPATVSIDLQSASDSGLLNYDNVTNDTTPTFDVSVNQPGVVELDWTGDGIADLTQDSTAAATFSMTPPALADGTRSFVAKFIATGGGVVSTSDTVKIDTLAPSVLSMTPTGSLNAAQRAALVQDGGPTITFSEQMDGLSVQSRAQLIRSPGDVVLPLNVMSFNGINQARFDYVLKSPLPAGTYQMSISQGFSDIAGNATNAGFTGTFDVQPLVTLFVDATVTAGLQDGSSWDNAFSSLQAALSFATSGQTIRVADGTYKPTTGADRTATFQIKSGVKIEGGYAGFGAVNPDARDVAGTSTILSGDVGTTGVTSDNSYHVVTGSGTLATAILDGVTITAGQADAPGQYGAAGGGLLAVAGSPTIVNTTFTDNISTTATQAEGGGGAGFFGSNSTLTDVTFQNNTANRGGGLYAGVAPGSLASTVTVTRGTFLRNNSTSSRGAGAYATASTLTINDSSFIRNAGGALYASTVATLNVNRSKFYGNTLVTGFGTGAGILNSSGSIVNVDSSVFVGGGGAILNASVLRVTNSTFSANTATSSAAIATGTSSSGPTTTDVSNSIVWGNSTAAAPVASSPGTTSVTHSLVEGGFAGTGNLNTDPSFVRNPSPGTDSTWGTADDDYGDLRLQPGSPAVNAGSNAAVPAGITTDIAGNARIVNTTVDMGAYELQTLPGTVSIDLQSASDTGTSSTDNITNDKTPTFDISVNQAGLIELDLTGDGISDLSQSVTAAGTYALTASALLDGRRDVTGYFTPTGGTKVSSSPLSVTIDSTGPRVSSSSFNLSGATTWSGRVIFSGDSLDLSTVSAADVTITGPGGNVPVLSFNGLDFTFARQETPGGYTVTVGPDIKDLAGNLMDQNANGTQGETPADQYTTSFSVAPKPDLQVTGLSVNPASPQSGNLLTVNWNDFNSGAGAATVNWKDHVTVVNTTTGQTLYDSEPLYTGNNIAPGGTAARSVQFTLPDGAAGVGNLRITVMADSYQNFVDEYNASGTAESNNTSTINFPSTLAPYPDLIVTGLSTNPVNPVSGDVLTINWTDFNNGGRPVSGYRLDRIQVINSATGAQLWDQTLSFTDTIAAGTGAGRSTSFTLPNGSPGVGNLVVTVTTDSANAIFESNAGGTGETNNSTTINVNSTLAPYPDLIVTNLATNPANPVSGDVLTINWTDFNNGGRPVSGYRLDRIQVINSATGAQLWDQNLSFTDTIAAGTGAGRSTSFTLPNGSPGVGNLVVTVTTDSANVIFESNAGGTGETNNSTTINVNSTLAPYPDLSVAINPPADGVSGRSINIRFTVTNQGTATAGSSWVDSIYITPAGGGTDVLLGTLNRPIALAPGQSYTRNNAYTLPAGITGQYRIKLVTGSGAAFYETNTANNTAVSSAFNVSLAPYADLRVDSVTAQTTVTAGQRLSISWAVSNRGTGATDVSAWFDDVYISKNPSGLDSSAIKLGTAQNASYLGVNESYSSSLSAAIPTTLSGTYYVYVVADSTNTQSEFTFENNNSTRSALGVQIQPISTPAFFDVTPVVVSPATGVFAGQSVYVTWTVTNSGGEPITGAWSDAIALSPTAEYNDLSARVLQVIPVTNVVPLNTGESYTRSAFVTIPANVHGDFFIVIDPDHTLTASETGGVGSGDVAKNTGSTPINIITPPLPDLKVDQVSSALTAQAGTAFTVNWKVTNDGFASTNAGAWSDAVYLSPAPTLQLTGSNAATLLGTRVRTGGLAPAGNYNASGTFTIPTSVAGSYYVIVLSDVFGQVTSDNANSTHYGVQSTAVSVSAASGGGGTDPGAIQPSDLRPVSVSVPVTGLSGAPVNVSWTVTNAGPNATAATQWNDRLYLSDHNGITGAGVIDLGNVKHNGALAVNGSYSASKSVTLPNGISGTYYFFVVTNADNAVAEGATNNANNTASGSLNVQLRTAPRLEVSAISNPDPIVAGQSTNITWTVQNNSVGSTLASEASWTDSVYLSDTPTLGASALRLASFNHSGGLGVNGSYLGNASITLPLGVSGSKYIIVATDVNQQVYQGDPRPAGTQSKPVTIASAPYAVLSVPSIATPPTAIAGQAMTVSWTVSNSSAASATDAATWYDAVYLSRDQFLDPQTAISLGSIRHDGALAAGASYNASLEATIPTSLSGLLYVFVVTDVNQQVYQAGNTAGNTGFAATPVSIQFPELSDLEASTVSIPPAGITGQPASPSITWSVTNTSARDAIGSWFDAVYLSVDDKFDSSDTLIARVKHNGGLVGGNSYTASTNAKLPAQVVPGAYRVIVRADSSGIVRESSKLNNQAVSSGSMALDVAQLTIDVPSTGTLAPGESVYYRVNVSAGDPLKLTSLFDRAYGGEFYVSYGRPPTLSQHDLVYGKPSDLKQIQNIPNATAGTYYILLHRTEDATGVASYSLTANVPSFGISSIDLSGGSNAGEVTMTVSGAKLPPTTIMKLINSSGGETIAKRVLWKDESTLWVTFDLRGLATGSYSVRATDKSQNSTLTNSFNVNQLPAGQLQIRAVAPGVIRAGTVGQLTYYYENKGNTDITAPLMLLTSTGAKLRLENGTLIDSVQILGTNRTGPAGVLPPGFVGSVTYNFVLDPYVSGQPNTFKFDARQLGEVDSLVNWSQLKEPSRPAHVSTDAWDGIWQNVLDSVGSSLGDFQNMLGETATYLSQLNRYTNSIATLLSFKFAQADASLLPTPIATANDLSVPSIGLSLELVRAAYSSLTARNHAGMLGLGWLTPWDARLLGNSDGGKVVDFTTAQIAFVPDGKGNYVGPAGSGTLALVSGQLVYTDRSGTRYGFNNDGAVSYLRDKNGNQITASFTNGKIVKLLHSDGASISMTYTPSGYVSQAVGSNGLSVNYVYDASGQHLASATTSTEATRFGYISSGTAATNNALSSIEFTDGSHRYFAYDSRGRLIQSSTDDASQSTTFAYDNNGKVISTDAAGNESSVLLTDFLKPGRTIDPRGNITRYEYDSSGNPQKQILAGGLVFRFQYDTTGQIIGMVNPSGSSNTFAYSSGGFLSAYTNSLGARTTQGFDSTGNLSSISTPDGSSSTFVYDSKGQLVTYKNARNQTVTNTYNAAGLLTRRDFTGGTFHLFTYDARGNLTSFTDSTGTTGYTYNGLNQLQTASYPGGRTLSFVYDSAGRKSSMTDETGYALRYDYDTAGRLTRVADGSNTTIASYAYDSAGRISRQDNRNGTATTYEYDAAGNVTHLVNLTGNASIASQFTYTYDALNRVSSAVTSDGNWGYAYDSSGQLTRAIFTSSNPNIAGTDLQYNYDSAGNRISVKRDGVLIPFASNQRDQYIEVNGTAYSYDADGNLTSDGANTYSYDALGRLTGITDGGQTTTYTYNAIGQRVATSNNGQVVDYVIDPLTGNAFTERSSIGNTRTENVFGAGLVSRSSAGDSMFYSYDGIGSTTDLTGNSGSLLTHYAYDPFGQSLTAATSIQNPYQFLGRSGATSSVSGLVSYGSALLNLQLGRTQSPASSLAGGDANAYRFLNNAWTSNSSLRGPAQSTLAGTLISGTTTRLQAKAFTVATPLFQQSSDASSGGSFLAGAIPNFLTGTTPLVLGASSTRAATSSSGGASSGGAGGSSGGGTQGSGNTGTPPPRSTLPPASELAGSALASLKEALGFASAAEFTGTRGSTQGYQSTSLDPNAITGPQGYGPDQIVGISSPQIYRIDFENVDTATAPAQVVNVTTQLSSKWDWRTLELKRIVFNHHVVEIPEGSSFYSTIVDLRSQGENLLVSITAGINPQSGVVSWKLSSIDPTTGEAPTDPNIGALPVNNPDGDGQGYLVFAVRGRSDVPTGSITLNQATITFDDQPPLSTDTWLNVLDTGLPVATLNAAVASPGSRHINVSWTGTDDVGGSGVAGYDIFVSSNGGASYQPWLQNTLLTNSEYIGKPGRTYLFYALAYDNAGNISSIPAGPQASASIAANVFQGASILYNNSVFDGNNPSANAADDAAIATDKTPLRPGQLASFANYTSYSKGINGIVIDLGGEISSLTKDDFIFKIGNSNDPATWTDAPAPTGVSIRTMPNNVARVTLIWADNAIRKTWLQVTIRPNDNTGLSSPVVFYYGNAIGDTGNSNVNTFVNATDEILARNNSTTSAALNNPYDFNRDGAVDSADELVARSNGTTFINALKLIDLASSGQTIQFNGGFVFDAPKQHVEFRLTGGSAQLPSDAVLNLVNLSTGQNITRTTLDTTAADVLSFSFDDYPSGLPKGNYRAVLASSAGSSTLDFFALPADANRDRRVNTQDFNVLAGSFGQTGKLFSQGDFNYDGVVDALDFNLLVGMYGESLAENPAPTAVASVAPTGSAFGSVEIDNGTSQDIDDLLQ